MNNLLSQLRRGWTLRFWLAVLAAMCLTLVTFLQPILATWQQGRRFDQGYHNDLMMKALTSDVVASFLPLLAAIPFAAGYLEDVKSKFSRFYLIRGSYSGYLLSHFAACWLYGGGVVFLGPLIVWGITALVFTPVERAVKGYTSISPQILNHLVLLFWNGGLWAVVGLTMSTIMESIYIAYASPFIVYYLLVILYERYFPEAGLRASEGFEAISHVIGDTGLGFNFFVGSNRYYLFLPCFLTKDQELQQIIANVQSLGKAQTWQDILRMYKQLDVV